MEQAFVNGIILVHGAGRVILVRFVQGHKEYVQLLFRQPLHTLADGSRLQKVQCYQQLVAGIGAVQVQRTIKAYIHRFVDKINAVILILQKCLQFPQQNGTIRESIQVIENFFILPAFCSFAPEGHIEHLQHPLLYRRQGGKIGVVQFWQKFQQKPDPPAGICHGKTCKGFGHNLFKWLYKIRRYTGQKSQPGKTKGFIFDFFAVNCTRVKMVVVEEIAKGQRQAGVLREGHNPCHKPGGAVVGSADVIQHIFCGNFLQLNIAALGCGDKALFELPADAAGGI